MCGYKTWETTAQTCHSFCMAIETSYWEQTGKYKQNYFRVYKWDSFEMD